MRARVPRRRHGEWRPPTDRPDPVAVLMRTNEGRLSDLVPVRHGRMMESPFAYHRGAPAMMAADLSCTPASGVTLQLCGDAHLLNFGSFRHPRAQPGLRRQRLRR